MMYRPNAINELRTPVKLLAPIYQKCNGVCSKIYPSDGELIFVNWKSYGGTESAVNGIYSILDTAHITTWYRPDIQTNCRLLREDGEIYEIISEPENIDLNNVFCEFKVERVKGGV